LEILKIVLEILKIVLEILKIVLKLNLKISAHLLRVQVAIMSSTGCPLLQAAVPSRKALPHAAGYAPAPMLIAAYSGSVNLLYKLSNAMMQLSNAMITHIHKVTGIRNST
jgi:hypothetical protein